ncbi:hypothetical protein bcgnr5414_65420 [Bacillus cereus]
MEDQLKDFIHYMVVEKGLAKNTVVSYERDLKSYVKYLDLAHLLQKYIKRHSRMNIVAQKD